MDYSLLKEKNPAIFTNHNAPFRIIFDPAEIETWQEARKKALQQQGLPETWADIGVILDDRYIVVLRDLVEFPGGFCNGYLRIFNRAGLEKGASGVAVLPVKDGLIGILRQFRHATREWHWEIPRGFGESGLSAEENAAKEVKEEIHGEIEELIDLGRYHNNTGMEGHFVNLFLVKIEIVGEVEKSEGIESLQWVSVNKFEDMVANGEITDGFSIAAYTRAKLKRFI